MDQYPTSASTSSGKVCFQFAESGKCRYGESCKYSHTRGKKDAKTKNSRRGPSQKSKSHGDTSQQALVPDIELQQVPAQESHMDVFFSNYPSFQYNRRAPLVKEFYRMCDHFAWDKDDDDKHQASFAFKTAMVRQFNSLYGTDVDDIESWRKLCLALNITPLDELRACRKAIRKLHVNLVDLIENERNSTPVRIFKSLEELRAYTIRSAKFFPKESAYAGGVLRYLLREILNKRVVNTRQ